MQEKKDTRKLNFLAGNFLKLSGDNKCQSGRERKKKKNKTKLPYQVKSFLFYLSGNAKENEDGQGGTSASKCCR